MSIGNIYNENKNDKKTDEYYLWAQKVIEGMHDSLQLGSLLAQRGTFFDQRKQFDSAMIYQLRTLQIAYALKNDYLNFSTLSNIGLTYKHQNKTALALNYFDSVLTILKSNQQLGDIAAVYNNVAATQAQAGNYAKAKEAFATSIQYARQNENRAVVLENYRNMADMYDTMKDYKNEAFYLKQYYTLKDSIFTSDNSNQLTQLEADYHLEQKNGELVKQESEVQKQKGQRNIFIILAAAGGLLLITLALFYSRIKKKNSLLEEQNIQINKQKDELQTLNHVKDRLFSIISHDLRNPLVTLRSYLTLSDNENISAEKKEEFKTQTKHAVTQTSDMLDNLLAWANLQIKNTRANITPVSVQDAVQDAINVVQAQAQQKNIVIHKELLEAVVLADENILAIALRNLLTNAIKYSGENSNIHISSHKDNDTVALSVQDEGIGMTEEQVKQLQQNETESTKGTKGEKGSGLGIFLVMELLEKTNGHLFIQSEKNKGSNFTISLPAL
jgi:signal transduction histidine kinase